MIQFNDHVARLHRGPRLAASRRGDRGGLDARGKWLVHSGNDGNAVRTLWPSLGGAIAFRLISSN
jgi:hypothetical protein